ncbi:hypothetical protein ACJX0J_039581, partial [Zea mays]
AQQRHVNISDYFSIFFIKTATLVHVIKGWNVSLFCLLALLKIKRNKLVESINISLVCVINHAIILFLIVGIFSIRLQDIKPIFVGHISLEVCINHKK